MYFFLLFKGLFVGIVLGNGMIVCLGYGWWNKVLFYIIFEKEIISEFI